MSQEQQHQQNAPHSLSDGQESCLLGASLKSFSPGTSLGSLGSSLVSLVTFQAPRVLSASFLLDHMFPLRGVGYTAVLLSRNHISSPECPEECLSLSFCSLALSLPGNAITMGSTHPQILSLAFAVFAAAWTSAALPPSNLSPMHF